MRDLAEEPDEIDTDDIIDTDRLKPFWPRISVA